MKIFGRSWKTGLTGVATIITGVASLPWFNPADQRGDLITPIMGIIAGIGLIFAKDANVGGQGNVPR